MILYNKHIIPVERKINVMKRVFSLILAIVLLLASAACAEDLTLIENTTKNTIKLKKSYADNPVVEGVSSTTGLAASGEEYTPILLVLDNAEDAYPHWGVSQADILFQIPNAGSGATKLMALFADHYPEQAGGARSARASMVPVAKAWDAAFAYAGGPELSNTNVDPFKLMRKWSITKSGRSYNLLHGYAERVSFVQSPHNSSAHILQIHEDLLANGVEFEQRPFLFTDEPRTEGDTAEFIKIVHRGDDKKSNSNAASYATYTYDAELGGYIRTNSSGDYTDRDTGEVIPFANVIVLRITFGWNSGYVYLKNHLTGSGVAEIFQNGKYVRGAWFRDSQDDRIVFIGPDGAELPMQRGKTFIVVTNSVTEVSYR